MHSRAGAVRIGTWNTGWAVPGSARGVRVRTAITVPDCDILCVTEGSAGLLPDEGHLIDAGTDWGYDLLREDRRKTVLWGRHPWTDVDCTGSPGFPGGRFVKGVTESPIGPLTVIGVCIPWDGAHVRNGRRDRKLWEDHRAWLGAFERLPWRRTAGRTVVLGDFNQRIPRTRAPKKAYEALLRAFKGLEIATAGEIPGAPGLTIDHIAHTPDLRRAIPSRIWPKRNADDEAMSDHFGVWADFSLAATT